MKTSDSITLALAVGAAAWYLFSADGPEEFFLHALVIAGAAGFLWLIRDFEPPASLIEQEFGPPDQPKDPK